MTNLLDMLMKKFRINISQIIANSDNTMEDVRNEAYIILSENYSDILTNNRVFINELKTRCLKFNKYNRRIESKDTWEKFNALEDKMKNTSQYYSELDEDMLCDILDIKKFLSVYDYDFLIYYYNHGGILTAEKYNSTSDAIRQRVRVLISKLRKYFNRR